MGRDVAAISARAHGVFQQAGEVLGFDIARVCFEGPADQLERTDLQQPAIFVTSLAIWEALREARGAEVAFSWAGGLSLGEYTALCVAGAVSFESALRLVYRRGCLMQEAAQAAPSGMVSLMGGEEAGVQALCEQAREEEVLAPANFNCPGQVVISGSKAACERAVALASEFGFRATQLSVAGAFHSALMEPAARRLREELERTEFVPPRVRVIANVSAEYHGSGPAIRESLFNQLTRPVLWRKCVERMIADGADEFLEVGPGRILTGLIRKTDRKAKVTNLSSADSLAGFSGTPAKPEVDNPRAMASLPKS